MADRQCGREDGEAEIGPSANEIAARIIYVYMYMCIQVCVYIQHTHTHTQQIGNHTSTCSGRICVEQRSASSLVERKYGVA